MFVESGTPAPAGYNRRAPRIGFQLPVRCRRGVVRSTIMLKDMTTHGAKIEGLADLHIDEPLTLLLPDLQPMEAYVTWSSGHSAGVEFGNPLRPDVFGQLVADYAIGGAPGVPSDPVPATEPASSRFSGRRAVS